MAETQHPDGPRGSSVLGSALLGLPEGVRAIAYRPALENEHVLMNGYILSGEYAKVIPSLVVAPVDGYSFVYDIQTNRSASRKMFDQPKRVAVVFDLKHSGDEEAINKLQEHPCFAGMHEVLTPPPLAPGATGEPPKVEGPAAA